MRGEMRTSLQTVPSGINMFKLLKYVDNLIELMKLQEFYWYQTYIVSCACKMLIINCALKL